MCSAAERSDVTALLVSNHMSSGDARLMALPCRRTSPRPACIIAAANEQGFDEYFSN
jgi:hypothetical protein